MFLEYEKEILRTTDNHSCLTITATGLPLRCVVQEIIFLYANEYSLLFLLNLSNAEYKYFDSVENSNIWNINGLTIPQRIQAYLKGGVFYGPSRAFITDFINNNVNVKKISSIFVLNADKIEEDSTESFLLYIFKKYNELALIKAFSSNPISLSCKHLSSITRNLCLNKVLFYPRFHETVKSSIKDQEISQVYIKQNNYIEEISIMLLDIMKDIFRSNKKNTKDYEYMSILLHNQKDNGLMNFKRLLSVLFTCDALSLFLMYKNMMVRERSLKNTGSWTDLDSTLLLFDKIKEYLEDCIKKSCENPTEFIYDVERGSFRIFGLRENDSSEEVDDNIFNISESSEDIKQIQDEITLFKAENCEIDTIQTNEQKNINEFNKEEVNDSSILISELLRSKKMGSFYKSNPKLKAVINLLNNSNVSTIILVQNKTIKKFIRNSLLTLINMNNIEIKTYCQFEYSEGNYQKIILISPSLKSIRLFEYQVSKGKEIECYILAYKNSLEEQRHLEEIKEEKLAFEKMILDRGNLPLKLELEVLDIGEESINHEYEIVIDSREMRAKLPFYLYKAGNKTEVKVMDIGDYMIGENKCIERKSLEDFKGSLNSGRLYQQAQKMTSIFDKPILMLEFEDSVPTLINNETVSTFKNTLIAKFCLFLTTFPKFQVLWSNNPTFSVKLIRDIQKKEEYSKQKEATLDPQIQEILLTIPGINNFNLKRVIKEFLNIRDLAFSDLTRLEKVFDSLRAKQIFDFFRQKMN